MQGVSITVEQAHPNPNFNGTRSITKGRGSFSGSGRVLGAAFPIFDVFHIFSLDRACTACGGTLDFRTYSAGDGPDLIGSEDMFWYCYQPKIYY